MDYAKHGADDVRLFPSLLCPTYQTYHVTCEAQQKGLEVLAVLRDLRQARLSFQDGGRRPGEVVSFRRTDSTTEAAAARR